MTDEQKPLSEAAPDSTAKKQNDLSFSYQDDDDKAQHTNENESKKKIYLVFAFIPILLALIAFGLWKTYQPRDRKSVV